MENFRRLIFAGMERFRILGVDDFRWEDFRRKILGILKFSMVEKQGFLKFSSLIFLQTWVLMNGRF